MLRSLLGLLRLRCPRCLQGKLFRGILAIQDPCPECGLIIQREEGYFLGAMYVSYLLGCLLVGGGFFVGTWLAPNTHDFVVITVVVIGYFAITPFVFRYSRAIWIYYDRWGCLDDTSAGAYEKARALRLEDPMDVS